MSEDKRPIFDLAAEIGEKFVFRHKSKVSNVPIDWNEAIRYAGLVKIAESIPPAGSYGASEKDRINAAGYKFLQPIYGNDLATDLDPHLGDVTSVGFLAVSSAKELVVAIRGANEILEWLKDVSYQMVPSPILGTEGNTGEGFTSVYRSLRAGLEDSSLPAKDSIKSYLDREVAANVTVCGHGLGGAVATLLTLDVALNTCCNTPTVYTYGSPRAGDRVFAGSYNAAIRSSYRIASRQDIVAKLPPKSALPYEHVQSLYELISQPGIVKSLYCMHRLSTYLWLMGQLVGTSAHSPDSDCTATGSLSIA